MCILGIFVVEIVLHVLAFRMLYLKDYWNVLDIVIIIISIVFVLLDILLDQKSGVRGFLKIRGVFRLLRVFILVRKLNAVRLRREIMIKSTTSLGYDLRSPLEKVLEILNGLRDGLDNNEKKLVADINYCIKMISSNKLYDA